MADLFDQISERHQWLPTEGSVAGQDEVSLPTPDPRLSDSDESGFWLITDAISSHMAIASELLRSVAGLYQSGNLFMGPEPLIRSTAEGCARVVAMLPDWQKQKSIPAEREERLVRAYLEHLASALHADSISDTFAIVNGDSVGARIERLNRLLGDIQTLYPRSKRRQLTDLKSPKIDNRLARASLDESVQAMHSYFARNACASITKRAAHGVYDLLTAVAHPTLFVAHDLTGWERESDGVLHPRLQLDSAYVEKLASYVSLTFYLTVTGIVAYYDWPGTEVDAMTSEIESTFSGIFSK